MTSSALPTTDLLDRYTLTFDSHHLRQHMLLLGNREGFVLYLPAARNTQDRTLQSSKWVGASGFGRSFFEGVEVWVEIDGTLWALHRLFEYTRDSGDTSLVSEKMPMVQAFFQASMNFMQRGLLPSGGIIEADYLWETWEDTPYTPRAGYPVEIEMLWLTVLREFLPFVSG
jgi:hypothetical protein